MHNATTDLSVIICKSASSIGSFAVCLQVASAERAGCDTIRFFSELSYPNPRARNSQKGGSSPCSAL